MAYAAAQNFCVVLCARARNHAHGARQRRLTWLSRSVRRGALLVRTIIVTGAVGAACTVSGFVSYRVLSP